MKKRSHAPKLLGYVFIPVIFCLIGYLIIGIALKPVWEEAYNIFGLLSADDAPNFNPELTSIYDPNKAEENPVTVYVEEPEEEIIVTYEYINAVDTEAPEETEEEELQEHYLYLDYADQEEGVTTTDSVTGEITDAEEASERQLVYIYESDEKVEDLADAHRVAFAYVETDEDGRSAAYIYQTEQDAEEISEDTPYNFMAYLDELGLQDMEEGDQVVLIDTTNGEDLSDETVDETGDEIGENVGDETSEITDENADKTRNAYIISYGTTVGGNEVTEAVEPGKVTYKFINFQNIMENLAKAKAYIHIEDIDFPLSGTHYAQLICERIDLDCPVYWNDTSDILRYGAGQYLGSFLPGFGRIIVLSAHNNTFFTPLKNIKKNDIIEYNTHYGDYKYRVKDVQILNEKDLQKYISEHCLDEEEELIMYTCYPFEATVGRKTDRLTVFAERISGYDVKWRDLDE